MLYLASRSPRRAELLARLDVPFRLLDVEVPEQRQPGESPHQYVRRVALDKAQAGWTRVAHEGDARVLGSDTEVVLDDEVFGKPADAADAASMLRRLSGRTHEVATSVWLVAQGRQRGAMSVSAVTFDTLSAQEIADYVASGEPMGKAGAYAIQGRAERFVTHLAGSHSGVMGLPLHQTAQLLKVHGEP